MSNPPQIDQQAINGLWSIHANASHDINHFSNDLFNRDIDFGEMIAVDNLKLIQLWPGAAYLFSEHPELPAIASIFKNMITDISHGFCTFKLSGESTLTFLNNYCSADLKQPNINGHQCLRTSMGHYLILLWWDDSTEIHLLINRSYAQSFADYLNVLASRN